MNTIFVISPNPWGNLHISKHNYAIALASLGNKVYFMNPPNQNASVKDYTINSVEGFQNLYVIDCYLWNNKYIDFLRWRLGITQFYDWLLQKMVQKICQQHNIVLNQVWNFDPNLHGFMHKYKANKTILFVADQIAHSTSKRSVVTANAVISVANEILEPFKPINKNCLLINHGLNKQFEDVAKKQLKVLQEQNLHTTTNKRVQVGYIGNLLMPFVHEENLKKIVTENPNIDFHFWGAYSNKNNNLLATYNESIYNTVQWIKQNCKNTQFYGVKKANEIVDELTTIDAFIYINSSIKDVNGGANSHKILEYLSTGKVIISTYLSYYNEFAFFPMTAKGEEDNYTELFSSVINNLEVYNSVEQQTKRVHYALENTYEKNIQTINQFLQ